MSLYHSVKMGSLEVPGNLFLAPVAGYTERAFRSICIDQGADFTCTELISSEALTRDSVKTESLILRADNEKRYAVQLFGSSPEVMAAAVAELARFKPDVIDINCGCPVPKVVKTGAGSALLRDCVGLGKLVAAVKKAIDSFLGGIPLSVKIRSGWDEGSINYRETAQVCVDAGADLVALHARTRAQQYAGKADWDHIGDLSSRLSVPVIGSGDLFTPEDAQALLEQTGCAGLMFARGAMGNPFIFSETKSLLREGSYTKTPAEIRIQTGFHQLQLLALDRGEAIACKEMRKQFCSYTKGMDGGASLRNRLVHAETIGDYREILAAAQLLASDSEQA
ncbi:tRNA dihydrouridine synthase DusB [Treponema sp.]